MTTSDRRINELLDRYGGADASPGELLCGAHPPNDVAFTVVEADLRANEYTYGELSDRSARVAGVLAELGVVPGDRVATLMSKSIDLVTAVLAIWRLGAVQVPLFTAFAPPAIAMRLTASGAKVVVVDSGQREKLDSSSEMPSTLPWQIITAAGPGRMGDFLFDDLLAREDPKVAPAVVGGDAPLIMIFTSGTTGTPKGVVTPVRALAGFCAYLEQALDVRPDDVYWDSADPGWAYGAFYAIAGPLASGRRSLLLRAGFSAELTWRVLSKFGVTNFTTVPTVYRGLRNDPSPVPGDLVLRCASSTGEPLTPDVETWAQQALGVPVRNNYGQTELGMVIGNAWQPTLLRSLEPGSMGHPFPGWQAAVLLENRDAVAPPGMIGRVAIDVTASPLFAFTGYHEAPEKTAERMTSDGRWYITGDTASRNEDGYFFFSARDDDVIIMAGYRIGPFEVESVLVSHPDVAEAAVIAVPDELRGEVIEAFVVPRIGIAAGEGLAVTLQQLVKKQYAAHAYPRFVHFVDELPKTPSGKIQRAVLRSRRRSGLARS